jgi:uncharacterized YccA/Bax inhibitor family protein
MQSSNPALRAGTFAGLEEAGARMTLGGVVGKTLLLLILCAITAAWAWLQVGPILANPSANAGSPWLIFLFIGPIGGLVLAIVTAFKKQWAAFTGPLYALCQGVLVGAISAVFEQRFPGIAAQAVGLTFGVMLAMLVIYQTKLIKVTERFRMGVAAATCGVLIFYLLGFVLSLFGMQMPSIFASGWLGIGISAVIAALNLVLDFDAIAQGVATGAPKYMEWYSAFALMVTLIWLYLEILRLLSRVRR